MLADAAKLGTYHLEAGLREFGAWSQQMVNEMGERIRPHLQAIWQKIQPESETPNAPTFYSKAAQVVNEKVGGSGSGDQILATLRNNGVKENEIGWMGLDDYLKGKPKVSKADLQQFVNDNQIQLQESTRGTQREQLQKQRDSAYAAQNRMWEELRYGFDQRNGRFDWDGAQDQPTIGQWLRSSDEAKAEAVQRGIVSPERLARFQQFDELGKRISDLDMQKATLQEKPVKYEQYTLPGDKSNYSEMLMKLPEEGASPELRNQFANAERLRESFLGAGLAVPGDVEVKFLDAQQAMRKAGNESPSFKSSHFDEPNVLAHTRFDDRVDVDGKRNLFLEEVQSDWHQKGKRDGYKSTQTPTNAENKGGYFEVTDKDGKFITNVYDTVAATPQAAIAEAARRLRENPQSTAGGQRVPDAPFKSDWHELAMKRMLRYAAENDYDRMSWTTGQQQAERYDLSKNIDKLEWHHLPPSVSSDGRLFAFDKNGNAVLEKQMDPSELPDYIGKDAAQKLLAAQVERTESGRRQWQSLSGLDLKTGGDWAKALYDRAIPNFHNKYAKKWGAKAGATTLKGEPQVEGPLHIRSDGKSYWVGSDTHGAVSPMFDSAMKAMDARDRMTTGPTVHSIDITPAMKKSVLKEGQPISKNAAPEMAAREQELQPA
jgi:hypothetical protein